MRYIVQAVPERKDYVEYLRHRLPSLEVHWDDNYVGSIPSMQAVCRMAGEDPFVRLEDDALLCQNFAVEVQRRIDLSPHQVHKLSCNEYHDVVPLRRFLQASKGSMVGGFTTQGICAATQALYFPPGLGLAYADFLEEFAQRRFDQEHAFLREVWPDLNKRPYHFYPQDVLLGYTLFLRREPYITWIPGLVGHRVGASIVSKRRLINRPLLLLGDESPPLSITQTSFVARQWPPRD